MRRETRVAFAAYVSQIALLNSVEASEVTSTKFTVAPALARIASRDASITGVLAGWPAARPLRAVGAFVRDTMRAPFSSIAGPLLRRVFPPFFGVVFPACLSLRTKARINSSFRIECQPRIPRFLAI